MARRRVGDGVLVDEGRGRAFATQARQAPRRRQQRPALAGERRGNLIDDGQGRTYTYDNAGRLAQVFNQGTVVATYVYNAEGRRTRKETPQGTTLYHYDINGNLIATGKFGNIHAELRPDGENKVKVYFLIRDYRSNIEEVIYKGAKHLSNLGRKMALTCGFSGGGGRI